MPGDGDVLVVSAEADVGAVAIAEFQRLMLGDPDGTGGSDTRVRLFGNRVFNAVDAGDSSKPIVAVERDPVARLEVVTQVAFEGSDGLLGLGPGAGIVGIARPEIMIGGEEPDSGVAIENPFAEALGVAEFRFEGPAVRPPVNQLGGIVLAGGSDHFQSDAEQDFLMPFEKLTRGHRRATLKIDRKAIGGIRKTGAVEVQPRPRHCPIEVPDGIGQGGDDVGGAAKEAEGVVQANNGDVVCSLGVADWKRAIEIDAAIVEGPNQGDGVGMQWRDEISARGKVLSADDRQKT